MNATTGAVLARLDLGAGADLHQQIPRGLALRSDGSGAPQTAYVLNTLENSISVVDVTNPAAPSITAEVPIWGDKTPDAVRRGRIAFSNAFASDTGSFSCESCHPDGNMDQLLWRIGGACFFGACTGDDEPRTTMPVRGLKNTIPLHWDGTLGDPFGGSNGAVGDGGAGGTDCVLGDADGDHDCFLDLVLGSLSGVMCDQSLPGGCPPGGHGLLSAAEQDDMATFLASVSYPPARSRRMNDSLSTSAVAGFSDFFVDHGDQIPLITLADPATCADSTAGCHVLPLLAGTNSSTLEGFDVPTMRGMTDRFVQFSIAPTAPEEILADVNDGVTITIAGFPIGITVPPLEPSIAWDPNIGFRESTTFGAAFAIFTPVYNTRPIDIFQMFEESSTGYSGSLGRQVTLNTTTTNGGALAATEATMNALEAADARGVVNLRATGLRSGAPVTLSFDAGAYKVTSTTSLTHAQLIAEAQAGTTLVTLTGALRKSHGGADGAQPLLALPTSIPLPGANQDPGIPNLTAASPANPNAFTVVGTDVRSNATVFVDGQPAAGATLTCSAGVSGNFCVNGNVSIDLLTKPATGVHVIQVLNDSGQLSNEMPLCVGSLANCQL
jgi:hypothetical protein